MPARRLSPSVVGYISERLVEVYAILGTGGKLTSFKPGVDVDHRDLIFDERGRNRNVYAQVKCALAANPRGLFEFNAYYPAGDPPSTPRFVYILCHLDVTRMAITHIWLVPSADFNRLASRSIYRGGIHFVASPGLSKHSKWNPWLIPLNELGRRLLYIAQHAPAEHPLSLPDSLLFVRQ
jgi:hypothetical protein